MGPHWPDMSYSRSSCRHWLRRTKGRPCRCWLSGQVRLHAGPVMVTLFLKPLGVGGAMWIFAILYAVSGVLAFFLKLPEQTDRSTGAAAEWPSVPEFPLC